MKNRLTVFVGTYTQPIRFGTGQVLQGKGEGIYSYTLAMDSGVLGDERVERGIDNPSYLTLDKSGRRLYAVNELKEYQGQATGAVSAFRLDRQTRSLTLLSQQPTGGTDPCHVVLNRQSTHVFVSNFMSGSVCVFPVGADGSLDGASQFIQHQGSSVNPARQAGPHAHSLIFDPTEQYAFVPDLGIDRVMAYRTDFSKGVLETAPTPYFQTEPGSGPRHCTFHPSGKWVYLINELASTISVLAYDAHSAALRHLQTVPTVMESFAGENTCADIHLLPGGRFLYGSNRGHNSLIIYRIDQETGLLEYVGTRSSGGEIPRNFCIDPTGTFLLAANQDTDNIVVFRINQETGDLVKVSEQAVPTPVCVKVYGLE